MTRALLLVSVLAGVGCTGSSSGTTAAPVGSPSAVPSDGVISMHRGACLGPCPVYTVEVHADGRVTWNGSSCVAVKGPATSRIDTAAISQLWRALEALPLARLPRQPPASGSAQCRAFETCMPGTTVEIREGGRTRTRYDNHGCEPRRHLEAFRQFQAAVDEATQTEQWSGVAADPTGRLRCP